MEFERLVKELISDDLLLNTIEQLLSNKRAGFESEYLPKIDIVNRYIENQLTQSKDKANIIEKYDVNYDSLNRFFLRVLQSRK